MQSHVSESVVESETNRIASNTMTKMSFAEKPDCKASALVSFIQTMQSHLTNRIAAPNNDLRIRLVAQPFEPTLGPI